MKNKLLKGSPTPSDVHVSTAMGNDDRFKRLSSDIKMIHKKVKKMVLEKENNYHDSNGNFTTMAQAVHDKKVEAEQRRSEQERGTK